MTFSGFGIILIKTGQTGIEDVSAHNKTDWSAV